MKFQNIIFVFITQVRDICFQLLKLKAKTKNAISLKKKGY